MKAKQSKKAPEAEILTEVERPGVRIKIKAGLNRVGGVAYPQWSFRYRDGAGYRRKRFATLEAARRAAELVATKLSNQQGAVLAYTAADWATYTDARAALAPLGVALNTAVAEYVAARKALPQGVTLGDVVGFWRKRHPTSLETRSVEAAVKDYIAVKTTAGLSAIHLRDLDTRLGRFTRDFGMEIGALSGPLLQAWMDGLKGSPRSKRNYMIAVASLLRWCVTRKYAAADILDELKGIQLPKAVGGEVEIFTPSELSEILNAAPDELKPWLAIAAFAGLRTAEIQRLDWADIDFKEGHITVPAAKSKTASRRVAPMLPVLARWLQPHRKDTGRVCPFNRWNERLATVPGLVNAARRKSAIEAGKDPAQVKEFKWHRNAMRHSFCSYRLAVVKDVARLAYEAGNSPAMIHAHYKSLVPESQAAAWFAVEPETKSNIVPLTKGIAS